MSRSMHEFAGYVSRARDELHALAPQSAAPELSTTRDALAALMALCHCRLTLRRRSSAIVASIRCQPVPEGNPQAQSLLDLAMEAINRTFREADKPQRFALEDWLTNCGFLPFVTALVRSGASLETVEALTRHVAGHVRTLAARFQYLGVRHCQTIIRRDVGKLAYAPHRGLPKTLHWALAPDLAGRRIRPQVMMRRRQALEVYGSLASVLIEPEITRTIDAGEPLNARLGQRLDLGEAHLRQLRGLRPVDASLVEWTDFVPTVKALLLHEVPLHQWPSATQWSQGTWRDCRVDTLLRPDYLAGGGGQRDAFEALKTDLLAPLAGERAKALQVMDRYPVRSFASNLTIPVSLMHTVEHRLWLRAVRNAVIGPRGIKAFEEATQRWHRRAATIAALRHEERTDAPGWPALCPPWKDAGGQCSIVALTSADDLVAEGNALDHCVGGYYSQCRTGETQILSMRMDGKCCATLELLIQPADHGGLAIRPGQFKAHRNGKPDRRSHDMLRAFLEDLRDERHTVFAREIVAYRRKMARASDYAWSSGPLALSHARRAFPLHRTLLPKTVPETFDAWCESTGLTAAFDAIISAIAATAR